MISLIRRRSPSILIYIYALTDIENSKRTTLEKSIGDLLNTLKYSEEFQLELNIPDYEVLREFKDIEEFKEHYIEYLI